MSFVDMRNETGERWQWRLLLNRSFGLKDLDLNTGSDRRDKDAHYTGTRDPVGAWACKTRIYRYGVYLFLARDKCECVGVGLGNKWGRTMENRCGSLPINFTPAYFHSLGRGCLYIRNVSLSFNHAQTKRQKSPQIHMYSEWWSRKDGHRYSKPRDVTGRTAERRLFDCGEGVSAA